MSYSDFYKKPVELLPDYLQDIREIKAVLEAVFRDLSENVVPAMENIKNNAFIALADDYGLKRWEKIAGVVPLAGASLDERREALLATGNNAPPYTDEALKKILSDMCGENGFRITPMYDRYQLLIEIGLDSKTVLIAVRKLMARIIPCNIAYSVDLLYNIWEMYEDKTWGGVSNLTWREIREEVQT